MYKGLLPRTWLPLALPSLLLALLSGCAAKPAAPAQAEAPAGLKDFWCYMSIYDPQGVNNTLKMCLRGNDALMGIYFSNPGNQPTFCRQHGVKQTLPAFISIIFDPGACKNGRFINPAIWRCLEAGENLDCRNEEDQALHFVLISKPEQ